MIKRGGNPEKALAFRSLAHLVEPIGREKALNLIRAQLVRLATGWDFDKPGGELGNEAHGTCADRCGPRWQIPG